MRTVPCKEGLHRAVHKSLQQKRVLSNYLQIIPPSPQKQNKNEIAEFLGERFWMGRPTVNDIIHTPVSAARKYFKKSSHFIDSE